MGHCLCKEQQPADECDQNTVAAVDSAATNGEVDVCAPYPQWSYGEKNWDDLPALIDRLVLETLAIIRQLVDNDQDLPPSLLKLHTLADKESGWLMLVNSIINVIPLDDPLGPAVITLLLDDGPLPTKESILTLSSHLKLSRETALTCAENPTWHRNVCIVLGCIAEKMAGPSSVALLTKDTLDYLVTNLSQTSCPVVVLFSIIALEKFAQTSESKLTVHQRLVQSSNALTQIESWMNESDFTQRQAGFCSQWCLDNLFLIEGRTLSYENIDYSNMNAVLNNHDVSEYLKISSHGLQARCDATSFESVRCTFQADEGVWYYEATVVTAGVMQIGWATRHSKFQNHEGYGIGDDEYSVAYDGCRQLIWHNAKSQPHRHRSWKSGDIFGTLLDLDALEIIFYLNGVALSPNKQVFQNARSGYFAAASFMSFQQCEFNFGSKPFEFPPQHKSFKCFNDHAVLSDEDRIILPRQMKIQKLKEWNVKDDSCTLCFDNGATVQLEPCQHRGFCSQCALMLDKCPMCREYVIERVSVS